ncbi:unnamed protein product [Leptosia nina]|uniref:Regucalcin n=1 Tax=Leptosia nina TaxID=320188 RepID=A0AAV1J068_9NEOP
MSPSPIRYRGPWKIQKRSTEPDQWLDEMGFFRKHTARDSSCLFRAVSENIFNTQRYCQTVKISCIEFMSSNQHLFEGLLSCTFESYLKEMSNPTFWGGMVEVSAMSHLYRRDFVIFEANKGSQTKICNGYGKPIYLFYFPDTKHFDAVYTKEFISDSAFCQSLMYELLYDRVYHLEDLSYAVDKMLHDKASNNHFEYFMSEIERKKQKDRAKIFIEESCDDKDSNNNTVTLKCKHYTNDIEKASLLKESLSIYVFNRSLIQLENVCMSCLNVNSAKGLLDNGVTPFPYKVAKALDPEIYRNIEFDVWTELRRELRFGAKYSDGTTLQVGVKCLCKLEVDQVMPYHCHIQEMGQEGGPCLVFIEELGEKRIVKYDQLEPLPIDEIKPWAPPYRYSRVNSQLMNLSQILQQIGNIARKQNLKSGKKARNEEAKTAEKERNKINWNENKTHITYEAYDYPLQHLDSYNFHPMPVELDATPVMVDIRAAGGPAHEMNGTSDTHTQASTSGGAGDMGNHPVSTPVSVRASTPATTNALATYSGVNAGPVVAPPLVASTMSTNVPYNCGPYMCGMKSVLWCSPHSPPQPLGPGVGVPGMGVPSVSHLPPPPPQSVNLHVFKSVQANGADLPMNDIATLRYYFNLGVECMWATYGPPPQPPHVPPPMHPPPRHYSPAALAQDMQQMSMHDRPSGHGENNHKHKQDKNTNNNKGNGQRPLLGPRFKRGNNQDNNQNNNHNQNKGHSNNINNKGPNNRRSSYIENRTPAPYAGEEMANAGGPVEAPIVTFPYAPYPPPMYPVPYYHIDDPAMMGMMGGMSGMGYNMYEDGLEYGVPAVYGAPPPYHPHMHHPPPQPPVPHEPKCSLIKRNINCELEVGRGSVQNGYQCSALERLALIHRLPSRCFEYSQCMSIKVEIVHEPVLLGEGPHWDEKRQSLFFVDINSGCVHKYVPATGERTKAKVGGGKVGFIVPVEGSEHQFVVGVEQVFKIIEWDGLSSEAKDIRILGTVDQDNKAQTRINDGKADPKGRIYAGSMCKENSSGAIEENKGSLFNLDNTGKIKKLFGGIFVSNGLAWDVKEKAMYYTDSLEYNIRRYDYDVDTGAISNLRYVFDFKKNGLQGAPDGTTIDDDGNLWIAAFNESCVIKVNPRTGELLQKVPIPVAQVTSVAFGGPDLDVLFVTTANIDFGLAPGPQAGSTFVVTGLGVKGLPSHNYVLQN